MRTARHPRSFRRLAAIGAVALGSLVALAATPARAQDEAPEAALAPPLAVVVKGRATVPAETLEIELTVGAVADESREAQKKFRETAAKVRAALEEPEGAKSEIRRSKKKADKPPAPGKGDDKGDDKKPSSKKHRAVRDDDDDDEPPKKAETKKADKPEKAAPDDDDEDKPAKGHDDSPAPKADPAKPEAAKPEAAKPDAAKPDAAKPDAPRADAPEGESIPVEVLERELSLGTKVTPRPEPGMPPAAKLESGSRFGCKLIVRIKGVAARDSRTLARRVAGLIDAAVAAGADGTEGVAPVVRLLVEDPEKLHALAYKDALARARTRAGSLADLAGLKIGRVISVREVEAVQLESLDEATRLLAAGRFAGSVHEPDPRAPDLLLSVTDESELLVEFQAEPSK